MPDEKGFHGACPLIADYFHRAQLAELLAPGKIESISSGEALSESYRCRCWFTGTAMVAAAIFFSCRGASSPSPARETAAGPEAVARS